MVAGGAIGANRIVKPHSTEGQTVLATATTDLAWGVCAQPGGAASGDRLDVVMHGIADVVAGGSIAMGALVTADSNGAAVTLNPGAGVVGRALGVALDSAASGDIFRVVVAPSQMKG
jgi:hypothetical protein